MSDFLKTFNAELNSNQFTTLAWLIVSFSNILVYTAYEDNDLTISIVLFLAIIMISILFLISCKQLNRYVDEKFKEIIKPENFYNDFLKYDMHRGIKVFYEELKVYNTCYLIVSLIALFITY